MVELIFEICKKLLISFCLIAITGYAFSEILTIGESPFQSLVVLSFYVYCFISLFTKSRHKLFFVVSLPIFTQFIQIFQKYAFTTGANSIWRLLPFLILDIYFVSFFLQNQYKLSQNNRLFIFSWIVFHAIFLIISPNLEKILFGGIVLYLITLPLFLTYLHIAIQSTDFQLQIEKYLCLLFIILGLGTFGLVVAAAGYKGSDNLLATRNIADTNVTMAYFILLWPFAILYAIKNKSGHLVKLALLSVFLLVVILSFSRGAVLLVLPYLVLTLLISRNFVKIIWLLPLFIIAILYQTKISGFLENQDLTYFWKLRFGDMDSFSTLLKKLEAASGRVEIHRIAYGLFLESPIVGHGIGSFEKLGPGYREAHSLWYTLLAEEGVIGIIYHYSIFFALIIFLWKTKQIILLISILFYLIFNHTVGSVFVILPSKSITINCIAPILLMCSYFYSKGYNVVEQRLNNQFHFVS